MVIILYTPFTNSTIVAPMGGTDKEFTVELAIAVYTEGVRIMFTRLMKR